MISMLIRSAIVLVCTTYAVYLIAYWYQNIGQNTALSEKLVKRVAIGMIIAVISVFFIALLNQFTSKKIQDRLTIYKEMIGYKGEQNA